MSYNKGVFESIKWKAIPIIAVVLLIVGTCVGGCAKKEAPPPTISNVTCYTKEGHLIYEGQAQGYVWVSHDTPRVSFKAADTGLDVDISGGYCVVLEADERDVR